MRFSNVERFHTPVRGWRMRLSELLRKFDVLEGTGNTNGATAVLAEIFHVRTIIDRLGATGAQNRVRVG